MAQRITIDAEPRVKLDARWDPDERGAAVVAAPHPEMGGRMDNPVVDVLAQGLADAALATLRFDWRGAGASTGTLSGDEAAARADYAAALDEVARRHTGPYVAAGYSFGAATALRIAAGDPRIARAVLVAPPIGMLDVDALASFTGKTLVLVGDDDVFAPLDELKRALSSHPRTRLHVIAAADHFFMTGGLGRLAPPITDFCRAA